MATLDALKSVLRHQAAATSAPQHPLSETQYSEAFELLTRGPGWATYQDFIIPQLSEVLRPLFDSRIRVSVLEIGPGPRTVLGHLPCHLRRKINKYTALEPNGLFATQLQKWISSPHPTASEETEARLPCLESPPNIHQLPFVVAQENDSDSPNGMGVIGDQMYDVVIFCHSMYGIHPKSDAIRQALETLVNHPRDGLVVVSHRHPLQLDGLVCHQSAVFSTGIMSVPDQDEALDCFAAFIAGFTTADEATHVDWRRSCRALGRREPEAHLGHVVFAAPEVMVAFTRSATALPELLAKVPLADRDNRPVKNRSARLCGPAAIVRPTDTHSVQECVWWALSHGVGLTVLSGGHSGHCLWPNVVAVDMGAFDQVSVVGDVDESSNTHGSPLVWAGAGCKTGDIVRTAMAAGLTVPLGARPSVGMGLVLQGGIGHLTRMYGLSCDAIVGAIVVGVASGEVLCVGRVPNQHRPAGAICRDDSDLLWALRGAGTNFGIVVGLALKAYPAQTFVVRNWVVPLSGKYEGCQKLKGFDKHVARGLPPTFSSDSYLHGDVSSKGLCLSVSLFEVSAAGADSQSPVVPSVAAVLGPETSTQRVDGIGVFESELYMSGMHGGLGTGKTSSFKRCIFLKNIGEAPIANVLLLAVETRPTTMCYLHLLHGGGAVKNVESATTAFGCRDWEFACVITGVWPRDQDGTEPAHAAIGWVYKVVSELLPLSSGIYGADLGPDPRDVPLGLKAFGPNTMRLGRLKNALDPQRVLAHACPLPSPPSEPKLIVLVTGDHGAGKDYCADIWAAVLTNKRLSVRVVSISEAIKREYAVATGASLDRLLRDRKYKEHHRPALTAFFQSQLERRPRMPEEHFLYLVRNTAGVDVLLITGMREEAPVPSLSHLVPRSQMLEVCVEASQETRQMRRWNGDMYLNGGGNDGEDGDHVNKSDSAIPGHRPSFFFRNDTAGKEAATSFAERYLAPFFDEDRQRLAGMVRRIPDFPRKGIDFRHVLDIAQRPGGLALCTSLLKNHFAGDWSKVDVVVGCEAGGFVFASALAALVNVRMALVRAAGKLPPPAIAVERSSSHISSVASFDTKNLLEMERDVIPKGASVVVVDDVFATGRTVSVVLRLLYEAGVGVENMTVLVVAEFPIHRGRELLRQHGFGRVSVQSLLVFDGA